MVFWVDEGRHNWSLVMVTYQSSEDQYRRSREDMEDYYEYDSDEKYYGEDDEYSDEDYYYAENKTKLTHTYPFWIGAAENTAYSCGV